MKTIIYLLVSMFFLTISPAYAENGAELVDKLLQSSISGDENKVLETRKQIESLPAVSHGDRKAARELNTRGLAEFGSNNFENAVNIFLQAHKADPADAEIASNLGYSYLKLNKPDEAKSYLGRSLILSPGRSSAWAILAQAYAQEGDPTHAVATFNLTWTFSQNKEKTKAFLEKIAAENPGTATAMAAIKSIEHQSVKLAGNNLDEQASVSPMLVTDKRSNEKPAGVDEPLQTPKAVQQSVATENLMGVESKTGIPQSSRTGLPGLRLGDILDPLTQGSSCDKPTEVPEVCAQAKSGNGDGTKARCLKQIGKDIVYDSLQLCSYPYITPSGELVGSKIEEVDVLLLDHRVIEIRLTVAVPIERLLAGYEAKYGEPASFNFKSYTSPLSPFQKKVYDEMKGSVSAVISASGFEIESVTWWIGDRNDMVLAMPPAERVHDNLDSAPSGYGEEVAELWRMKMGRLMELGVAPRYSDNPWTFYYTDFQALMELSDRNSKSLSENEKKRLSDL